MIITQNRYKAEEPKKRNSVVNILAGGSLFLQDIGFKP
jgi:hypothetical protein